MSNPVEQDTFADLAGHPDFSPAILHDKRLLLVPSQGEHNTNVVVGQEGEMRYEQRQVGEVTMPEPGTFVSRIPAPEAETAYRHRLFGDRNPTWHVPGQFEDGLPLDQVVLGDPSFLHRLGEAADGHILYGFHQTPEMAEIAETMGIQYYGNPDFAQWAGTKLGLTEFAAECGVPTPLTHAIHDPAEILEAAEVLEERGYTEGVVKVSHCTGSMGQRRFSVTDVRSHAGRANYREFMPAEFLGTEGAVIQGWIPEGDSVSLATFVDFDDTYTFTGVQRQLLSEGPVPSSAGAAPIEQRYLEQIMRIGHRLGEGYVHHHAYGPHTMDLIIPTPAVCDSLGLPEGEPLCHDENTRPGAATIARAWLLAITEGVYGTGWKDAKVKVPRGTTIGDVISRLDSAGLLITQTGPEAEGVFPYNGAVLDFGHEDACYILGVSPDDPATAGELVSRAEASLNHGNA